MLVLLLLLQIQLMYWTLIAAASTHGPSVPQPPPPPFLPLLPLAGPAPPPARAEPASVSLAGLGAPSGDQWAVTGSSSASLSLQSGARWALVRELSLPK